MTNQLVLRSLVGVRAVGQVAFWAHASLKRQLWDKRRFPLQVRTLSGQAVIVDAVSCVSLRQDVARSLTFTVVAVHLACEVQSGRFVLAHCSSSDRWMLCQSMRPKPKCVDMATLPADCQPGRPTSVVLPRMFCCALLMFACIAICDHASLF